MAVVFRPKIDNLTLDLDRDVANVDVTVEYDINWDDFDEMTGLRYTEHWQLVGVDPAREQVIYSAPIFANGISANGSSTTHRVHQTTLAWADLDEDPNGDDEIAARVTLTPRLPSEATALSPEEQVSAP